MPSSEPWLIPSNCDASCGVNEDAACNVHAAISLGRGESAFSRRRAAEEVFFPSVFICRDVSLLPFRAETIHPLNWFWPALAAPAAICRANVRLRAGR